MTTDVLGFIKTVRDSFTGSVDVYTQGSCYQFYRILKLVYPDAEAYYDFDHVITKIGDHFYDITGQVEKVRHLPVEKMKETWIEVKEMQYDIWHRRSFYSPDKFDDSFYEN